MDAFHNANEDMANTHTHTLFYRTDLQGSMLCLCNTEKPSSYCWFWAVHPAVITEQTKHDATQGIHCAPCSVSHDESERGAYSKCCSIPAVLNTCHTFPRLILRTVGSRLCCCLQKHLSRASNFQLLCRRTCQQKLKVIFYWVVLIFDLGSQAGYISSIRFSVFCHFVFNYARRSVKCLAEFDCVLHWA